jgi:hypothetical protein
MKSFRNSKVLQKLGRFGVQALGHFAALSLALFLILAWMLTGPFFQLGEWIAHRGKFKMKTIKGKI